MTTPAVPVRPGAIAVDLRTHHAAHIDPSNVPDRPIRTIQKVALGIFITFAAAFGALATHAYFWMIAAPATIITTFYASVTCAVIFLIASTVLGLILNNAYTLRKAALQELASMSCIAFKEKHVPAHIRPEELRALMSAEFNRLRGDYNAFVARHTSQAISIEYLSAEQIAALKTSFLASLQTKSLAEFNALEKEIPPPFESDSINKAFFQILFERYHSKKTLKDLPLAENQELTRLLTDSPLPLEQKNLLKAKLLEDFAPFDDFSLYTQFRPLFDTKVLTLADTFANGCSLKDHFDYCAELTSFKALYENGATRSLLSNSMLNITRHLIAGCDAYILENATTLLTAGADINPLFRVCCSQTMCKKLSDAARDTKEARAKLNEHLAKTETFYNEEIIALDAQLKCYISQKTAELQLDFKQKNYLETKKHKAEAEEKAQKAMAESQTIVSNLQATRAAITQYGLEINRLQTKIEEPQPHVAGLNAADLQATAELSSLNTRIKDLRLAEIRLTTQLEQSRATYNSYVSTIESYKKRLPDISAAYGDAAATVELMKQTKIAEFATKSAELLTAKELAETVHRTAYEARISEIINTFKNEAAPSAVAPSVAAAPTPALSTPAVDARASNSDDPA